MKAEPGASTPVRTNDADPVVAEASKAAAVAAITALEPGLAAAQPQSMHTESVRRRTADAAGHHGTRSSGRILRIYSRSGRAERKYVIEPLPARPEL